MKKVNDALNNSSSLTGGSRVEAPDPEGDVLRNNCFIIIVITYAIDVCHIFHNS